MHHSILLASALAAGALASPHLHKRARYTRIFTETQFVTTTVIVTVTAGVPGETLGPLPGSLSATATLTPISSGEVEITPLPSFSALAASASSASAAASASASSAPGTVGPAHVSGPSQADLTVASGDEYRNAILYHHNAARANHGAGPLTWDTACETNAKIAAETCNFAHYVPDGAGQGQNLFTVSGNVFNVTAGITESWYKSEFPPMEGHYGEASLDDNTFHQVGHLTQVLWKATTGVGCYSLDCGDNMKVNGASSRLNKYTVCNYAPQGNIGTLYADNVGSPISTTNLGSWSD
ncbi:PR-1-like protein [Phaeosphaeriaceae sp. SRC1lsM3a]|nr:PR-1-like protein [Stagonospora sp. SRC1lsM3a]